MPFAFSISRQADASCSGVGPAITPPPIALSSMTKVPVRMTPRCKVRPKKMSLQPEVIVHMAEVNSNRSARGYSPALTTDKADERSSSAARTGSNRCRDRRIDTPFPGI